MYSVLELFLLTDTLIILVQ